MQWLADNWIGLAGVTLAAITLIMVAIQEHRQRQQRSDWSFKPVSKEDAQVTGSFPPTFTLRNTGTTAISQVRITAVSAIFDNSVEKKSTLATNYLAPGETWTTNVSQVTEDSHILVMWCDASNKNKLRRTWFPLLESGERFEEWQRQLLLPRRSRMWNFLKHWRNVGPSARLYSSLRPKSGRRNRQKST